MKKIIKRKISYALGILAILAMDIFMYVYSLTIDFNNPDYSGLHVIMYLCVASTLAVLFIYVKEFLKSEQNVKEEKIKILDNRIKFHEKQIDIYKKEIEKLS